MALAHRSAHADHLAQQLRPAVQGLPDETREALVTALARVLADLDHRLRVDADEELGRLAGRIEQELGELTDAEPF